jgi:hypothetical protein
MSRRSGILEKRNAPDVELHDCFEGAALFFGWVISPLKKSCPFKFNKAIKGEKIFFL